MPSINLPKNQQLVLGLKCQFLQLQVQNYFHWATSVWPPYCKHLLNSEDSIKTRIKFGLFLSKLYIPTGNNHKTYVSIHQIWCRNNQKRNQQLVKLKNKSQNCFQSILSFEIRGSKVQYYSNFIHSCVTFAIGAISTCHLNDYLPVILQILQNDCFSFKIKEDSEEKKRCNDIKNKLAMCSIGQHIY